MSLNLTVREELLFTVQLASTFGTHVGYGVDTWAKLDLGSWAVC